ncbi:hypothetical protein R3I93_014839 [Phoxinus phoxinus]|uniref:Uncharacterized protein n=1 Tax=Phoxinus phoxinus TaxID=58324 RepID=A0AAN9H0H0_9TELE
MHHTEERR